MWMGINASTRAFVGVTRSTAHHPHRWGLCYQDLCWRFVRYSIVPELSKQLATGINAVSGAKQDEEPPRGVQDYIVGRRQPWLDGIATEPGVVRQVSVLSPVLCTRLKTVQFVAMRLGHGYTVEEQLANTANGGIQVDVYPSLLKDVNFYKEARSSLLDLGKSPKELNIKTGEKINLHSKCVNQLFH